MTGTFFRANH